MTASSKIVFFGNERLSSGFDPQGAPTLEALIKNGYDVVAVVSHFERGTGRKARTLEIQEVADRHGIPVLLPEKLSTIAEQLKTFSADVGVLVAYGKMVSQSIIDIFPRGIVNIHPSLLPQYRGSTPIEQAILDGVSKTGVSLMALVKQMDAGPIYAQTEQTLTGHETKQELTRTLLLLGGQMLIKNLPAILDGSAQMRAQDESKATFTSLLSKEDGTLNLAKPASQLEREVRAFAVWPKSRVEAYGQHIIVQAARVAKDTTDGEFVLACGNQTFLEIQQLTGPSGRTMSGADFLRGYKK
jgi:methionyl-tRNA formyltransferase